MGFLTKLILCDILNIHKNEEWGGFIEMPFRCKRYSGEHVYFREYFCERCGYVWFGDWKHSRLF